MSDDLFDLLGAAERAKRLKLLKRQDEYMKSMEALPAELRAIAEQIQIGEVELKLDQVMMLLTQIISLLPQRLNPNADLERKVLRKLNARLDAGDYRDV